MPDVPYETHYVDVADSVHCPNFYSFYMSEDETVNLDNTQANKYCPNLEIVNNNEANSKAENLEPESSTPKTEDEPAIDNKSAEKTEPPLKITETLPAVISVDREISEDEGT